MLQTPASEPVLAMLTAAQDRTTLRTVCDLPTIPSTNETPRARRRM